MAYESNNPKGSTKDKKKGAVNAAAQVQYSHQFVRYTPIKADNEAVRKFDFSGIEWFEWFNRLVDDGYKLSLNNYRKNNCVVSSLTCNNEKSANFGFILTARGIDATTALAWLYWLHTVRFESGWNESADTNWLLD